LARQPAEDGERAITNLKEKTRKNPFNGKKKKEKKMKEIRRERD